MRKCKECKTTKAGQWNGEKKWYGWVYWCKKCYDERFCKMINSSSSALTKYHQIYKCSPEEQLGVTNSRGDLK